VQAIAGKVGRVGVCGIFAGAGGRRRTTWLGQLLLAGLWLTGCAQQDGGDSNALTGRVLSPLMAADDQDAGEDMHEHMHGDMSEPDAGEPPAAMRCMHEHAADPRDLDLDPTPRTVWVGFSRDLLLPQPVLDWLGENELEIKHDAWHSTRRWDSACGESFASGADCGFAQQLTAAGLERAEAQQGAPGSGLAFLAMHRHMLMQLRTTFPSHPELFTGFEHLPRTRADAENPTPWKRLSWTSDNLYGFEVLEHIEAHLDQFQDDDALGVYIESNLRWTSTVPVAASGDAGAGVHAALHNQWAVNRSPGNLGRTDTALRNVIFWKLHAFLDDVWSRYRAARGLSEMEDTYMRALDDECYRMQQLSPSQRMTTP
jgi:hypothetical protein